MADTNQARVEELKKKQQSGQTLTTEESRELRTAQGATNPEAEAGAKTTQPNR